MSFQWGSQKLFQGLVSHEHTAYLSVFNLFLIQWIMTILSERCKPDNSEPHNSLKLSFTNIWWLRSNFVKCESFLESTLLTFLLYARQLGWLNWFWQFLCEGLSSLYAWSCSLCERRTSLWTGFISRKLCGFFLRFRIALLHSVLLSFSSIDHLLPRYARFLILFNLI